jgi:signal transduction histidine kinase
VKYDKKRMEDVLLKVLFNSIEAMPDGGKLSVKSSMGEEENEITVKVIDTGSGIAVHNMENVFKPFFTTKQGAIGLGLYMAKRIVKLHNGKIKIKSEKNRGTEVSITLPVCRQ